jgi:ATP phosphoribosyltransferase
VVVGGAEINPGDTVVLDADGAVVVPAERLDEVLGVLPAMASPTIMTLAAGDMRALETVVPKQGVNRLIPALKAAGARDILELPISKIVE